MINNNSSLNQLLDCVLSISPSHEKFLKNSFKSRTEREISFSKEIATYILKLKSDDLFNCIKNYLWTCEQLTTEGLYFKRNYSYRFTKFKDVAEQVYTKPDYMNKYLDGLLLTQVLWKNQFDAIFHLKNYYCSLFHKPFKHLEIGPGHGLLLYLIAENHFCQYAEAWDISESSLQHTAQCLHKLEGKADIKFCRINAEELTNVESNSFDSVVISEVLEHVENPDKILRELSKKMNNNAYIFINIPINSPAIDHIYHLKTVEQSIDLVESNGYKIINKSFYPMTGYTLESAIKRAATISCVIVAQKQE